MYFDQKGPLIFSASIHFALMVFFLIKSMIDPEKEPEEFVFEMIPPPSAAAAAPAESEPIDYEPEPFEMPEIPKPDPPVRREPEPVVERRPEPAPIIPAEPEPRPLMNRDDFFKDNPIKPQRIPKQTTQPRRNIDISNTVNQLTRNLQNFEISFPSATLSNLSPVDQDKLATYFARLKQAIVGSIETHPLAGAPLQTKVRFDLSPNGSISGTRILAGSGDAEFDRKVLAGLGKLGRFSPPPGLTKVETLDLTIRQGD
jgi:TonB family protein